MKKELLILAASMALASSMSASVIQSNTRPASNREVSNSQYGLTLAREVQPGDQRHGRGKDDKKGHKLTQEIVREVQPGDQRHGRGKDDKKGHKLTQEIAREAQPGDDRGHGRRRGHGKDDGMGHKVA